MREIKFRGKTPRGKWITGDLIQSIDDDKYIFPSDGYDSCDRYEVSPDTVGQYTGLKDKNGVEIYEGDVISLEDEYRVIGFRGAAFGWLYVSTQHFCKLAPEMIYRYWSIIGNIHDNPELLTKTEQR